MDQDLNTDQLINKIRNAKEFYELLGPRLMDEILISGHTPAYWKAKFSIRIDVEDVTPLECREIDKKLLEFNQEALFYAATAEAKLQVLKNGVEADFRDKLDVVISGFKSSGLKLPAASTLENLAKIEQTQSISATALAEMEHKFWKNILSRLDYARKIVENITWNNKADADMNRS